MANNCDIQFELIFPLESRGADRLLKLRVPPVG